MLDPSEKKCSTWKRMAVFLLDGLSTLILFLVLLFTLGNLCVKQIATNDIQSMNVQYQEICDIYQYPYVQENQYGLIILDRDKIIDDKVESGMSAEKAYEESEKINSEIEKKLSENETYRQAYKNFYLIYNVSNISCMFVSMLIFQLIVPLCTKKGQTLFMYIFKLGLAQKENGVVVHKYQILARFFIIFVVEYLSIYLLLGIIGEAFVIILSLVVISLTKNRLSFHDLILKAYLKDASSIYIE